MRTLVDLAFALVRSQVDDDVPRDITGPEIPPGIDPEPVSLWGWLIPVAILAAVATGFVMVRLLKPKSRRTKARDRALRQIDRLQNLQLLLKSQGERHFTLLAGILRRYIEKGFGITTARSTTNEFLESAARNPLLEPHLSFLREFMTASDIAKFAPPATIAEIGRELDDQLRAWLTSQSAAEIARRT